MKAKIEPASFSKIIIKASKRINYIKCEFCGKDIAANRLKEHLTKIHEKTLKDNTLLRLGMEEYEIPRCKYCNNPVKVEYTIEKTCDNPECKAKHTKDMRSLQSSLQQYVLAQQGKHHFNSEHIKKLNAKQIANGTHNFLKQNKTFKRNISKRNKTVYARSEYIQHKEDFNKEYFLEHFYDEKKDRFKLWEAVRYFQCTYTRVQRARYNWGIDCPNVASGHTLQNEVYDYLVSIYHGQIICNTKKIISPFELDIYLPEEHLAIEFDGCAYHSIGKGHPGAPWTNIESFDKKYHQKKNDLCETKGIQLLHIWDLEWLDTNKRNIWKSVLSSHLHLNKKIYARNCVLKKITYSEAKLFFETNHLQGAALSQDEYGLFYDDTLVSVMSFCKSRFDKKYNYELLRYCNLKGYNVIGGASKLLTAFRKEHSGSIVSFANRRWSIGNLYEQIGFIKDASLAPNYFYVDMENNLILNRISCQKHKLPALLGEKFDIALSETENMLKAGYRKIYDCGNLKYILA